MLIAEVNSFCTDTALIWQFIGYIFMIFKIVIPLLLLILGMIDLGKAVVASDDKAIKGATKTLMHRAIAAVIIFFIPTLVGFIFSIVAGFADVKGQYAVCEECLVHPTKECKLCAETPKGKECKEWAAKLDPKAETE